MNDWQYLPLGDLGNKMNFCPKVNLEAFLCLNVESWPRDVSRGQTLKMKEIGELVANLLYFVWINKLAFMKEDKHT